MRTIVVALLAFVVTFVVSYESGTKTKSSSVGRSSVMVLIVGIAFSLLLALSALNLANALDVGEPVAERVSWGLIALACLGISLFCLLRYVFFRIELVGDGTIIMRNALCHKSRFSKSDIAAVAHIPTLGLYLISFKAGKKMVIMDATRGIHILIGELAGHGPSTQ